MKRLFLRELRRQLTPALGLLILSWLLLPVMAGGVALGLLRQVDPAIPLLLLTSVTPWLLGVSAFAPDLEQGGEGFLARLPVSRLRVFAMRVGVVFALSALTLGMGLLGFELIDPALAAASVHGLYPKPINALLLFLVPLAGGVLSGLALRRGLLAFALTPALVGAPILILRTSEAYWGAPASVSRAGLFGFVAVALACAAWIQRAELGRTEVRGPLRRVALTFVPLLVLYGLGVGALRKVDFALAAESDHPTHYLPAYRGPGARRLAVVRRYARTQIRWGRDAEEEGREYVLDARSEGRWLLPPWHTGVSISPDERWLLTHDHQTRRFARWSLADKEVVESWDAPEGVPSRELLWSVGDRPLGYERTLWTWVDEVPCCVRPGGLYPRGGGSALVLGEVLDARGGVALVLSRQGRIERRDLRSEERATLSAPGVTWEDARLSPDGKWAFALGEREGRPVLASWRSGQALREIEELPAGFEQTWQEEGRTVAVQVGFDPRGRNLSLSLAWSPGVGPEWFEELRVIPLDGAGPEQRLARQDADLLDWRADHVWSPDGRYLIGRDGVLELESGRVRGKPSTQGQALLWLDEGRVFLGHEGVLELEQLSLGPPPSWLR